MEICGQEFCKYHSWTINDLLQSGHSGNTEKLGFGVNGWHFLVGVILLTASVSSEQEPILPQFSCLSVSKAQIYLSFSAIDFAYSATFLSSIFSCKDLLVNYLLCKVSDIQKRASVKQHGCRAHFSLTLSHKYSCVVKFMACYCLNNKDTIDIS